MCAYYFKFYKRVQNVLLDPHKKSEKVIQQLLSFFPFLCLSFLPSPFLSFFPSTIFRRPTCTRIQNLQNTRKLRCREKLSAQGHQELERETRLCGPGGSRKSSQSGPELAILPSHKIKRHKLKPGRGQGGSRNDPRSLGRAIGSGGD